MMVDILALAGFLFLLLLLNLQKEQAVRFLSQGSFYLELCSSSSRQRREKSADFLAQSTFYAVFIFYDESLRWWAKIAFNTYMALGLMSIFRFL